jgi:hypothetical protein
MTTTCALPDGQPQAVIDFRQQLLPDAGGATDPTVSISPGGWGGADDFAMSRWRHGDSPGETTNLVGSATAVGGGIPLPGFYSNFCAHSRVADTNDEVQKAVILSVSKETVLMGPVAILAPPPPSPMAGVLASIPPNI